MEDLPLATVYTWRHRESNGSAIPVHARSIKNGVAIQYLDGTVHVYRRTHGVDTDSKKGAHQVSFTPITSIIGDIRSAGSGPVARGVAAAYVSAIEVSTYSTPEGEREALFVSRAGGMIRKYDVPSGRLLAQGKLPFECRGLNAHMNHKVLLAWGYSCEMVVLDQITLKIKGRWSSLPDWPLPTSLFDDQVLVFAKSGMASYWKIHADRESFNTVQQIKQPHPMIRLPPPPPSASHNRAGTKKVKSFEDDGSFEPKLLRSRKQSAVTMFDRSHGFDPLISVKQVSELAWVVARRHGWMLYKWENGTLVDEISADVAEGIISIITIDIIDSPRSTTFGILTRTSKVIWVSDGNVQVIEPIWNVHNDEIITCAVYSEEDNLLSCFVVTEHGINVFDAHTDAWPVAWDPTPFRLQTFKKKTTKYISSVLGDNVVIGRGNDLIVFTPEMFLTSSEENGKLLYSLNADHRVTTLECIIDDDQHLIAAGTSDGRLIEVNANTAQVELSLQLFATAVIRIVRITEAISQLYKNFILLISLNSSVALVDRSTKSVWKQFPSNNLSIVSVAFVTHMPQWIVFEYEDKTRRIWDLEMDEEVDDVMFYQSLAPSSQTDKSSISSSITSLRRRRVDQAQKNKELDKLDNILQNKEPLNPRDSGLLISPPLYSQSPLMVIRSDLLIKQFSHALDAGDQAKADELYPTVRAVCSSIFNVPHTDGTSDFDTLISKLCPEDIAAREDLGVGLLSGVLLGPNNTSSDVAFNLSLFCMDKKRPTTLLDVDGETSAGIIVLWVSFVKLLAKYARVEAPPANEIYNRVIAIKGIKEPNLQGLARILVVGKGKHGGTIFLSIQLTLIQDFYMKTRENALESTLKVQTWKLSWLLGSHFVCFIFHSHFVLPWNSKLTNI